MDKEELIALKHKTVEELKQIDVDGYGLEGTDARLPEYVKECISNPDIHNLYELLAVKRFFEFLNKFEFRVGKVS